MTADDGQRRRARPHLDRAAMASNWRQVLLADAAVGVAVVVAGFVVLVVVSVLVGVLIVLAGLAYVIGGVFRWRRWSRLRAEGGLEPRGGDDTSSR